MEKLSLFNNAGLTLLFFGICFQSHAQEDPEPWWPSKYGEDDQRGAANLLTAIKFLEATKLIEEGKVYQLGQVRAFLTPCLSFCSFVLPPGYRAKLSFTPHHKQFILLWKLLNMRRRTQKLF